MKAKVLKNGGTIGIISPSSPSFYRSELKIGIKLLQDWGYNVVVSENIDKRNGFFAGTDEERAEDFNKMFARKDVDAIIALRGGYGAARILKYIDFDNIKNNPKALIGFSDITTLHLAINKLTDLVTFHGPGLNYLLPNHITDYTKKYFEKAVASSEPIGNIEMADGKKYLHAIGTGCAEGEIIGGNISIICSTLGTPYEIETDGKILLMEDLNTEPWIMDHMMVHLENAGKFDKVKAIVIGECYNCEPRSLEPNYYVDLSSEDIFEEHLAKLNIPVLYGLPLGHTYDLATVPIGVNAKVDADNKIFTILENGVED